MPEFQHVTSPVFTPTHCVTCMNHRDPDGFVDLITELPSGHLYLCAACVYTAGQQLGMLSPHQAEELRRIVKNAETSLAALEAALEEERANKVIPLDMLRDELKRQRGGRPTVPTAA